MVKAIRGSFTPFRMTYEIANNIFAGIMHNKKYYVYIATNKNNRVLYIGVTNDISRRIFEHKSKIDKDSFTCRYNIEKLVYCEEFESVEAAICAEKKLKGWVRRKKDDLIRSNNPDFRDLLES